MSHNSFSTYSSRFADLWNFKEKRGKGMPSGANFFPSPPVEETEKVEEAACILWYLFDAWPAVL